MRIKKTSQTTGTLAQVVNAHSDSTADAYSADYINNMEIDTSNISDGAVTAGKMDLSTMGYNSTNAVVIGSFVDSNNTSHTIYRKIYKFTDYTIDTTDKYKQYQLNLASYTIIGSEVSIYRTDATGVINTTGTDVAAIFTGSGNYVRIYYYGGTAQTNATVYLTVDYMD